MNDKYRKFKLWSLCRNNGCPYVLNNLQIYDTDCYQYTKPGSNVANFKLPFCSLLASTDRNHKETKLLPRSAADSNCLLLGNITGITTVKENTLYQLHKLVL
jgi:hypothetical protein